MEAFDIVNKSTRETSESPHIITVHHTEHQTTSTLSKDRKQRGMLSFELEVLGMIMQKPTGKGLKPRTETQWRATAFYSRGDATR